MFPPPTPPSLVWENPCWSTKGLCVIAGEARSSNVTAATIFAASRPTAMKRRLTPTRTSVKWSSANRDTNETTLCDVAGLSGSLGRLSVTIPPLSSLSVSLKEGAGMLLTCSGTHHRLRPLGRELGAVGCVKSPPSGSAWIWQEPCQRCLLLIARRT